MDLPVDSVARPSTFDEALQTLAADGGRIPIAGGTDLAVQLRAGKIAGRRLIDIANVVPKGITRAGDAIVIGAGASMFSIVDNRDVAEVCPALVEAARQVGAWPIQCRATLGGNLANASPAADTVPPLLVARAVVVAASTSGKREIPIEEFFTGPGATVLRDDELIESVRLPAGELPSFCRFVKLGPQREQIISMVSVALSLTTDDRARVTRATAACGAAAPTARRLPGVERALAGRRLDPETRAAAVEALQADIVPIDDVRAPAWYRRVAAAILLSRLLEEAVNG